MSIYLFCFFSGFEPARGQIYIVKQVHSEKRPTFYTLENLQGKQYPSKEYERTLRKAPPFEDIVFPIEKELATKTLRNGKERVKVRWLFYPKSFDEWIDKDKMVVPRG